MKIKHLILFFILFSHYNTIAKQPYDKFPLNKIGIKIKKEKNYILLTSDYLNEIKNDSLVFFNLCQEAKDAVINTISNPNFQAIINVNDFNENITFLKTTKTTITLNTVKSAQKNIEESCFIKKLRIINLGYSQGENKIGKFTSVCNQISSNESTYFTQLFFIETRNASLIVNIRSNEELHNDDFIQNIEYLNDYDYEKLLISAENFTSNSDFTNAKTALLEAINLDKSNTIAFEKKAEINIIINKYNEVIVDANEILRIDSTNINGLIFKGLALYYQDKHLEAIQSFENALFYNSIKVLTNVQNEYFSTISDVYGFIGQSYMNLNYSKNAFDNLNSALRLSNDSLQKAYLYHTLGFAKAKLDLEFRDAIKYYTLAINYYPESSNDNKSKSYLNRGLAKKYLKDLDGEISDYSFAIDLKKDNIDAFYYRGLAKLSIKKFKEAIFDFSNVIDFDKNKTDFSTRAFIQRGLAKSNLGEDGCPDIKKAIDLGAKDYIDIYNEFCK